MTEIVAAHLERVARLNEILDEIAAGRGPFKVDNWDFACSVIENSKALAKEAKNATKSTVGTRHFKRWPSMTRL